MSVSDPALRRVSVHAGTAIVDLALPSEMPVATLLSPIVDTLKAHGADDPIATRYQLSILGASTLNSSTTLARSGVRDGDVLVLSQSATPPPSVRYDDVAEAVSDTLDGRSWSPAQNDFATRLAAALGAGCLSGIGCLTLIRNTLPTNAVRNLGPTAGITALVAFAAVMLAALANRTYRDAMAALTLSLVATAFSAVAGFLTVPGTPGLPNVLLAAAAAAATAVLAIRVSDCGTSTLTAVSCFAAIVAIAAFAGLATDVPLHVVGAVLALLSLGLLAVAPRAALVLAGLSPKPADPHPVPDDVAAGAVRADAWLASLLAAFSFSAATGAILTVATGTPRLGCAALAAAIGALLLLRASSVDRRRTLVSGIAGVATIGTTFAVAALRAPERGPWIAAATALCVAGAIYFGFVAPAVSLSAVARKGVEVLECVVLIATVPLAGWICGLYDAARGLHPT
ncbi:type VII secretion integral membrane protein EccD [Mycobacterium lentiflavum]|uniref:type VII secretion integral membrane protein EccD n=1 Tax=Mycobacterium lentiflavum TaxID=141349 RepID=UPI000B83707C|nr:type VII secretion integral membrane protein EccD [Mycobacterium lentiflavum]